jgi:hypothetical protein
MSSSLANFDGVLSSGFALSYAQAGRETKSRTMMDNIFFPLSNMIHLLV